MNQRLFLALWPGPRSRAAAQAAQLAIRWPPGARLAAPEGLHVTLHFIGAVQEDRVSTMADACTVGVGRTELKFDRLEVWAGGLVALVPSTVPPALLSLHERLGAALEAQGLSLDPRPYRPHVTLARKAHSVVAGEIEPVPWRSEGYALVLSSGGRYTVVRRCKP